MLSLYVALDKRKRDQHDLGSILCLQTLSLIPQGHVTVLHVSSLASIPIWLTGTPTLVSSDGEVFRGHQALAALQSLAVTLASSSSSSKAGGSSTPEEAAALEDPFLPSQEEEEEEEELFTKKITQEDFLKASSSRTPAPPPSSNGPPPAAFKVMKD